MKRHKVLSLGLLLLAATSASAQRYMRVWQNGESDRIALSDINYSQGGSVITIGDKTYTIAEVDSITMVRTITVHIKDNQATVNLNNAPGVTYTAEGGHVVINNTNDKEEMEFVLSGTSNDASITYNGVYKCKFHLDGLNLTSTKGAALDIQCGKRIDLFLVDGTTNSLTDCAGGLQKAAFYCKGHMEVEGGGSLTVAGHTRHAIGTNENLILKENTGNITVTNAVSDAIHAGQYFWMDGGTLDLTGMAGDGIQAEVTNDPTEELNGLLFINGGSINMKVTGNDVKGIKCDGDLTITGGNINIDVTGGGSKGISAPMNMLINEDSNPTNIMINASGKIYTDPETDEDVRCMGINVKGNLTIESGTVTVYNTSAGSRGIKIDGTYTKGANAKVTASIKN